MLQKKESEDLFQNLQKISDLISTPVYWVALDSTVLGVNKYGLNTLGIPYEDFIGKTPYDLYPREMAEQIVQHNSEVMQQVNTLSQEEKIIDANGHIRYFIAIKSPLKDSAGNLIGLIGTSIEITKEKEAERLKLVAEKESHQLRLDNQVQQIAMQEQEKFAQLARKVAHDINSPLAALKMMIPLCTEIPENKRMLLNRATEGILDIANNLLSNYTTQNKRSSSDTELRQHLLVSDLLIQLLSEKKMQYRNRTVTFDTVIADNAYFAFIKMQATEFRRSISNLINNAVDALGNSANGQVIIELTADANAVVIKIQDNGKGMSQRTLEKMQDRKSFTYGKKNGHGLGLRQVWDMLEYNHGILEVESKPGKGTAIQLTFPRTTASKWIAQDIHLTTDNIIVILDDDESIHTAWNLRFLPILTSHPAVRLHHFTQGYEALNFLVSLSDEEKNRVILLSDYELLHQDKNGLNIIEESAIKNAMLVTSYYSNSKIKEEADRLGIKILPKQMASIIPIHV